MNRGDRLFELIQVLRGASRPMIAHQLADQLEVSKRTIYRDIASLQARGTPIEGAAGLGYILRKSYDLPPLNFDPEEIEAITVGLSLLSRTGDAGLQKAATRVVRKIGSNTQIPARLQVSNFGTPPGQSDLLASLRRAIRNAQVIELDYFSLKDVASRRRLWPIALIYFAEVNLLAAWCELRRDFRHFRIDRIKGLELHHVFFQPEADNLRARWNQNNTFTEYHANQTKGPPDEHPY